MLVQAGDDDLDRLDTTHRRDSFCGNLSICKVPNLQELLEHICKAGFEHHCAMVRSHRAAIAAEAVTTYLGWDWFVHE